MSAKALVLDETRTRFLLFREDNDMRDFPGGGLDFGEDVKGCIMRELREEAGLDVVVIAPTPSYFVTAEKLDKHCRVAYVLYETMIRDIDFTPSNECQEAKFFTKEEAEKLPVYANVTAFLKQFMSG